MVSEFAHEVCVNVYVVVHLIIVERAFAVHEIKHFGLLDPER